MLTTKYAKNTAKRLPARGAAENSNSSSGRSTVSLVIISVAARLLFTLTMYDHVTASIGKEPFSVATVDSSASHWQERMYWERAAQRERGATNSTSEDTVTTKAFMPFYLEQVPFWPVKMLMLLADATSDWALALTPTASTLVEATVVVTTAQPSSSTPATGITATPKQTFNTKHHRRQLSYGIVADLYQRGALATELPVLLAELFLPEALRRAYNDGSSSGGRSSSSAASGFSIVTATNVFNSPALEGFVSDLRARLLSLSVFDVVMLFVDAVVVTLLLKGVSVRASATLAVDGGDETTGRIPTVTVHTPSPTSQLFLHAANPLSLFCCSALSLRVIEHAVILALAFILLINEEQPKDGNVVDTDKHKKSHQRAKSASSSFPQKLVRRIVKCVTLPLAILCLVLLVEMSPAMIVLLLPMCFHYLCSDGRTSFLRYMFATCVTYTVGGFVAYRASIGLAELPTTTPPDAGHQSYLWQILLPEIAELAQATFVIGPIVAVSIVGLQLCDPNIWLRGYRLAEVKDDESRARDKNENNKDKEDGSLATTSTTSTPIPVSPVYTPLRALIVCAILFGAIVRRYYSLVDTLFAVIVVPSVITPHITRAMISQSFFIVPMLLMFVSMPLQHATYTSWVVKQMANANWLYFANLMHHGGLCLFCGQYIYTTLLPCHDLEDDEARLKMRLKAAGGKMKLNEGEGRQSLLKRLLLRRRK